jgi:hypothetical protein
MGIEIIWIESYLDIEEYMAYHDHVEHPWIVLVIPAQYSMPACFVAIDVPKNFQIV